MNFGAIEPNLFRSIAINDVRENHRVHAKRMMGALR